MANPPDLQYCKVYGNFKAFVADGGTDGDDLPDFVPMTGYGEIYPNVEIARNTQLGFKSTYFNSPISLTVDLDGDLAQGGRKYVMVLASSAEINPVGFNYTIRLTLTAKGESQPRTYGPFAFDVIPGGEVDLTDVFPVASSAGSTIIQGPRGETGEDGPAGPVGPGIPTGGAALQLIRKTADNLSTEWVSPDKSLVGLTNVDNTSDADKPVSTATQTALSAKAPLASPTFTGTVAGVSKAMVGLGNVDNTADSNKPVALGIVSQTNITTNSGNVSGLAVTFNIPTFTFRANRWYEVRWDFSFSTSVAGAYCGFEIHTSSTADAAGLITGLTQLSGGNRANAVANYTQNGEQSRRIKYATDTTVQVKFLMAVAAGGGTVTLYGTPNSPIQYTIIDLGAQV